MEFIAGVRKSTLKKKLRKNITFKLHNQNLSAIEQEELIEKILKQEEVRQALQYKANHQILGITQQFEAIVALNLPPEVLQQKFKELHEHTKEVVKLINEL